MHIFPRYLKDAMIKYLWHCEDTLITGVVTIVRTQGGGGYVGGISGSTAPILPYFCNSGRYITILFN